jgi:hypothetical protein
MGLIRSPDKLRLSDDDPIPSYLGAKVLSGQGITITRRVDGTFGHQAIIACKDNAVGSFGDVFVVNSSGSTQVPNTASLVLVNTQLGSVDLILPHPAEVLHWISIVCIEKSNDIRLHTPNENDKVISPDDGIVVDSSTKIFDQSNIEFQAAGDSLVFASNRFDTWFCFAKYTANWYQ